MAHRRRLLTLRAYARHRRCTLSTVQKAVATGRIALGPGGRVDPLEADIAWQANTGPRRDSANGNGHAAPGTVAAAAREVQLARARLLRQEYRKRSRELVSRRRVERTLFNFARRLRDRILAVPDRVSAIAAGMTDASEIHRLLTRELEIALVALADGDPTT
ncbi:MAG TPA: hypothetical protein VGK93_07685 [Candidatus Eisenbacteria bacterium]|jgi:hypothetical protein